MNRWKQCVLGAIVAWLVVTQLPFLAELPTAGNGSFAGRPITPGTLSSIFSSLLASQVAHAQTPPVSTTFALPQLAYGDGWYTALYFSNTTDAATEVQVKFYGVDGSALSVPIIGAGPTSAMNVMINPKGTAILEAPDMGALQQGWTEATLPPGVIGYGVFRQTVAGRQPQEAVVPLSPVTRQSSDMTWDEVGFTTAVAVVNPSAAAVTVSIQVYRDDGVEIGTSNVNLGPFGRTAFVLRSEPGLAGMTSRRGIARFTVSSGAVAALGLRFGAEAFTSIPVAYP